MAKATKANPTAAEVTATVGATKLERHPLSEKYGPKMADEELAGLGKDIKEHGQHDDIIMFEGKVLAGWNRYMGCLQQGVKPRMKDMDPGSDPVAVAFGTNFVRRRLGSVQKAFYGAQYYTDTGMKQADVAKLVGCSLNKLNQCVQLLKLESKEAKAFADQLRSNPDVTSATFDEMMIELGIKREEAPAPRKTNTHVEYDEDDFGEDDDDATGGMIDSLLGTDDDEDEFPGEEEGGDEKPARRKEIGENAAPLPTVGGKTQRDRATETAPSRLANAFRNMTPEDQTKFVKFAWGKLQQALNRAIVEKQVAWTPPGEHEPTPEPGKKGKKASADVIEAVKKAAENGVDPSVIARNKVEEDELLAGKEEVPAAKVDRKKEPKEPAAKKKAAPAKKAPAKKAPAKKKGK